MFGFVLGVVVEVGSEESLLTRLQFPGIPRRLLDRWCGREWWISGSGCVRCDGGYTGARCEDECVVKTRRGGSRLTEIFDLESLAV